MTTSGVYDAGSFYNRFNPPNTAPNSLIVRRLFIPDDPAIIAAVNQVLAILTSENVWRAVAGSMTPQDTSEHLAQTLWRDYLEVDLIGTILPYVTATVPKGCLRCDGATYNRVDYPELYAALEPTFQVTADTFVVPDLRDRFVFGSGGEFGDFETGGELTTALQVENLPQHTHPIADHVHTTAPHDHVYVGATEFVTAIGEIPFQGMEIVPAVTGAATVAVNSAHLDPDYVGDDVAHNNMPPYFSAPYCIVAGRVNSP